MRTMNSPVQPVERHELIGNLLFSEQTIQFTELLPLKPLLQQHLVEMPACLHGLHHGMNAVEKLHFLFFHILLY